MEKLKQLSKDISILYVEDDINILNATTSLFELFFKEVLTATDGVKALQIYKEKHPDLVITDISMPKMNGIELIEEIRKIKKDQPIVVISAHSDERFLLPLINLNTDGFILKPINTQQFTTVLTGVLEKIKAKKIMENYHKTLKEELEKKRKELEFKYKFDEKTNLFNKKSLLEDLQNEENKSLIIIDIKDFNSINLVYGYEIGDKILKIFGEFIKSHTNNKVYYIECGKYAVLTDQSNEEIKNFLKEFFKALETKEFEIDNNKIILNAFIVVAYRGKELLKKAFLALEELKKHQKNSVINFYHENSKIENFQRQINEIKPILKKAIKEDLIVPFFQPILNNKTGKIEKYEVLARIIDNGEMIPPFKFISIAEHLKQMPLITKIIAQKTFEKFKDTNYEFSLNISDLDLIDKEFPNMLIDLTKQYNINPNRVILEILENISSEDVEKSVLTIQKLKNFGFQIAIDDFGTQNSNFEKLLSLEIDYIKIDGKFIKDIDKNKNSLKITKAIQILAKSLNAKTVAEFVHSEEILKIVKDLGIEYSQGYYIAPPSKELQ